MEYKCNKYNPLLTTIAVHWHSSIYRRMNCLHVLVEVRSATRGSKLVVAVSAGDIVRLLSVHLLVRKVRVDPRASDLEEQELLKNIEIIAFQLSHLFHKNLACLYGGLVHGQ